MDNKNENNDINIIPIYENQENQEKNLATNLDKIVEPSHKTKLVLSGGGVKGIAHIGVLYALDKLKCLDKITEFAGTSIGSLIMAMYILGYSPTELYDFIKLFDLGKLKNLSILNIHLFGLDNGSRIEYVIKRLIKGKNFNENITLKELYDIKKKKAIFTTMCINTIEICYMSHETHPTLPLYLAIRMAISLPLIYCPVQYNGYYYIDGGCYDNYPMSVFKNDIDSTIGILLVDSRDTVDKIDNLETYISRVFKCIMVGMSVNSKNGYEKNTIDIDVESINIVDYEINDAKKDELFLKGYKSVMNQVDKLKPSENTEK